MYTSGWVCQNDFRIYDWNNVRRKVGVTSQRCHLMFALQLQTCKWGFKLRLFSSHSWGPFIYEAGFNFLFSSVIPFNSINLLKAFFMVAHQMSWQSHFLVILSPCDHFRFSNSACLIWPDCSLFFLFMVYHQQCCWKLNTAHTLDDINHNISAVEASENHKAFFQSEIRGERGALHCQSANWSWQSAAGANVCLQLEGWRVLLSSAAANTSDYNACHQTLPTCLFAGAISAGRALKPTFH